MKKLQRIFIVGLTLVGAFLFFSPRTVFGYQVPPLPDDNLIVNPWFRSASNPVFSGLDGWTVVLVDGVGWSISQKESNPSPDIVQSGVCANKPIYCGTGARWAKENNAGDVDAYPNVDAFMYQVVQADPADRKLKYFMHWVIHKVDVVEVKIYGSDAGPDGPWTEVWLAFSAYQDRNPPPGSAPGRAGVPWFTTPNLETVLERGYPFYKVELHARYPESGDGQGEVGVKVTGIYFATEVTEAETSLSTPFVSINPTILPTYGPPGVTAIPTEAGVVQALTPAALTPTVEPAILPAASATALPAPTEVQPTATIRVRPTETQPSPIEAVPENGGLGLGFLIGLLTAGLAAGLFLVLRAIGRSPR